MFWAVLGVGMLINTIGGGGGPSRSDMMRMHEQSMKSLKNTLNDTSSTVMGRRDAQMQSRFSFDFEPPPFPQRNYESLQQMQQGHLQQRQAFTDGMKQSIAQMKEQFFADNHYETQQGPNGKPQVLTDEKGQPVVAKGPESPEGKVAREEFDAGRRQQLVEKQDTQKDTFLNKEKQDTQQYLADNSSNLQNPQVQAELTRMVLSTQKRAFGLQQQHEDERWKVDLPPSEEIAAAVEGDLAKLRQMEQDQARQEEQSPDMLALMQHEQDVAVLLGEQKQLAQQQKSQDNFLMDPRRMVATRPASQDLGEVLPSYLSSALYNMGIYSA